MIFMKKSRNRHRRLTNESFRFFVYEVENITFRFFKRIATHVFDKNKIWNYSDIFENKNNFVFIFCFLLIFKFEDWEKWNYLFYFLRRSRWKGLFSIEIEIGADTLSLSFRLVVLGSGPRALSFIQAFFCSTDK